VLPINISPLAGELSLTLLLPTQSRKLYKRRLPSKVYIYY
jgi:hypothetical protein